MTVPWCVCVYTRRDGYARINEHNDFGCSSCHKPTRMFYENVVVPREVAAKNEPKDTAE